ncbi:MAG: hypothetical protein Q8Q25_02855 [bacterium]|nr:hypothetical protein [bacterium]
MNRFIAIIMALTLHAGYIQAMDSDVNIFGHNRETQIDKSNIGNVLASCALSTDMTVSALRSLQEKNFDCFDPQVGDSACQIRTLQLLDLLSEETLVTTPLAELSTQLAALRETAQSLVSERKLKPSQLGKFLTEHRINISLSSVAKFFGQAYFLTKCKTADDLRLVAEKYGVSRKAANNLRLCGQRALQDCSNAYIKREAQSISGDPERSLIVSRECAQELAQGVQQIKGSQGRASIPCLFGMQVILEKVARMGQPFLIKMISHCNNGRHEIRIPYLFDTSSGRFKVIDPFARGMLGSVAMIIRGYQFDGTREDFDKKFKKGAHKEKRTEDERERFKTPCRELPCHILTSLHQKLTGRNIAEVVLANAAVHPQFPGDHNVEILVDFTELPNLKGEAKRLRAVAQKDGMCEQNMRTFLITHIYPDTIGHVLEERQ